MSATAEELAELPGCHQCKDPIEGEVVRKRRLRDSAETFFHPLCWAEVEEEQAVYRERVHQEARAAAAAKQEEFRQWKIRDSVRRILEELPQGAARCGSPEFKARVRSPRLRSFAETYTLDRGSAALLGPSGLGKTTALAAMAHRLIDVAVANTLGTPGALESRELLNARRMAWLTGQKLVTARRFHPLGEGEAPLVAGAMAASLLLLDELGAESREPDPIVFEVIDTRYATGLPTIVTSGLPSEQFIARYGDALWRRLTERGTKVEDS
jgi:DNA replication protein DnaC